MSESADRTENGTITLKLDNVSAYMTQIDENRRSPPKQVAGIEWRVLAYPSVEDNVTYLDVYLEGENARKWTAWVDATFRIVKNDGGFGEESTFYGARLGNAPLHDSWGWDDRVTSENLLSANNGFVVDDSVEIRVDLRVTNVCGTSFNVFEIDNAFAADIKLKVGDSVFYANKGYLSVVSSVFRDTFAHTKPAERKQEVEQIELTDLDASEFREFLGVVYPTRYAITDANVVSLFRIADRLGVKGVIVDCETHLYGANRVPWFDKLKLAADLRRDHLKERLISLMTRDDITAVYENEDKDRLGQDVLQALVDQHLRIHHS